MEVSIKVNDAETLARLQGLSPEQYMHGWATVVKQLAENNLRRNIGGDFGHKLAEHVVQAEVNGVKADVYVGGAMGYIAEHVHTGGPIRPKNAKFLAIPIDKSVKGLYPREVPGLTFLRSKDQNKAFLGRQMKRKFKPLYVLKRSVMQKARPWWPEPAEVASVTSEFFNEDL